MPAYTALLTVNMVFEWHRSVEEMAFIFDFWLPRDFARAMENGGRIASLWRVDQIEEIPAEQVDEALKAIHRPGRFEEDGHFIPADVTRRKSRSDALVP